MAASYNIRFRGGVRSLFLISIGSMLPGSKYTCIVPLYISPHTVYLIKCTISYTLCHVTLM